MKQQLDPLTSSDERDMDAATPTPEYEESTIVMVDPVTKEVIKMLTPLRKDEVQWASKTVDITDEADERTATAIEVMKYQAPRPHRRRPGNAVSLAWRTFVVELKVGRPQLFRNSVLAQSRNGALVLRPYRVSI